MSHLSDKRQHKCLRYQLQGTILLFVWYIISIEYDGAIPFLNRISNFIFAVVKGGGRKETSAQRTKPHRSAEMSQQTKRQDVLA